VSRLFALPVLFALTGCSLVVDGEVGDLVVDQNARRDIVVSLFDFDPHIGQRNDIAIVRPLNPDEPLGDAQLEARAVLDPLPVPCFRLTFENGASFAANRVDFYADLNMDGVVSPPGEDHLWIRELEEDEATGTGSLRFIHDVQFDDLNAIMVRRIGPDITVALTGLDAQEGQLVTIVVSRTSRASLESPFIRSVSGIGIVGAVTGGEAGLTIPGILDGGEEYTVEIDFGEGAMTCVRDVMAPTDPAEPLVIDSIDAFDCGVTERSMVFEDITDMACR